MSLIADMLLIAGACGAAFYCLVLSRRLSRLTSLEDGVGGAIAGLSEEVSGMNAAIDRAQREAETASQSLADSTARAEAAARRLELLLASLHDLPEPRRNGAPVPDQPDGRHAASEGTGAATGAAGAATESAAPASLERPTFRRRFAAGAAREAAE